MINLYKKIEVIRSNVLNVRSSINLIERTLKELEDQITGAPLDPPDLNDLMHQELTAILDKALRKND